MKRGREESAVEGRPSASILTMPMGVGVVFANLVVRRLVWKDILHLSMTCKRFYDGDVSVYPDAIRKKYDGCTRFNLRNKNLATIPNKMFFFVLHTVRTMDLSLNRWTLLPDYMFQNLLNLQNLYLHHNRLASLPNRIYRGLKSLQVLYLSYNQLTTLPVGLFQGLASLQELHLGFNRLTVLPIGLFQGLNNLSHLTLTDNWLTSLPSGMLRDLPRLRELALPNNRLTMLPDEFYQRHDNLRSVSLHYNSLSFDTVDRFTRANPDCRVHFIQFNEEGS